MGGVAHFTPPIGKEFVLKKFICVFLSVIVLGSVFVLGLSAEEFIRTDPTLEDAPSLRSNPNFEYTLLYTTDSYSAFYSYLVSGEYTSSHPFVFSYPVYVRGDGSSNSVYGFFVYEGHVAFSLVSGGSTYSWISSQSLQSDSYSFYDFMINTVGVPGSAFTTYSNGSVFASAFELSGSVFDVGSSLVSFVTSSWITLVALVAFVLVLGFGVIRKLVKGV